MILQIKNKKYPYKILTKSEDIKTGMMGQKTLDGALIFKLKHGTHSFWMKDCLIPLDIIFLSKNKITKIYKNCQPCLEDKCEKYIGYGDMVIELNANESSDFKINDSICFVN